MDLGAMAVKGHTASHIFLMSLTIWLFSVISRHSLRESYTYAGMQSVYSAALVDWGTRHWLEESHIPAEMQSEYSAAPVD